MSSRPAALALTCLAMCAGATSSAGAATVTFGADVNGLAANNVATTACQDGTWWNAALLGLPLLGNIVPPSAQGSCQFSSGGIGATGVFGLAAPATGTVKAARVKVGNTTGPMRINVIRTLFQQTGNAASPSSSTPFLQSYGPTFTPAANSITTVPLDLPVRAQATPDVNDTSTVAGTDWLALEVLAPNVPVPLALSSGAAAFFFAAFPGPTAVSFPAPSANPLPNYGQLGLQVLMNADLVTAEVPASTNTPTAGGTTPPAQPAPTAKIGLGRPTAAVAGGKARVNLTCQVVDCSGLVTLRSTGPKGTKYGSTRFSGGAGKTFRVSVKLNSKGVALMRRKRTAKVNASVALTGAAAPTTLALTLKR